MLNKAPGASEDTCLRTLLIQLDMALYPLLRLGLYSKQRTNSAKSSKSNCTKKVQSGFVVQLEQFLKASEIPNKISLAFRRANTTKAKHHPTDRSGAKERSQKKNKRFYIRTRSSHNARQWPIISADKYYRALTLIGHISTRIDAYTNAHEQRLITNNATSAHHL